MPLNSDVVERFCIVCERPLPEDGRSNVFCCDCYPEKSNGDTDRQRYMRLYLQHYHKNHRYKYHKLGTTDIGSSLQRKCNGKPNFDYEHEIVSNELRILGLKNEEH